MAGAGERGAGHTPAHVLVHSIRSHWAVENQLHWSLDVAMREDAAQSYKDQGPHNQTLLRRMALQLLKKDGSVKVRLPGRIAPCQVASFLASGRLSAPW